MKINDFYQKNGTSHVWRVDKIGPNSVYLVRANAGAEVTFDQLKKYYTKVG